jgi:hypothetical protein
MEFNPESGMVFDPEPTKYGVVFAMDNDAERTITSCEGEVTEGKHYWMDTRQLSVNDTVADKFVNITLVKLTSIGEKDVPVATGQVPAATMVAIYEAVNVKQKSIPIEMKNMQGKPAGTIKVKIMFTTELLKTEEEKKDDEMVPAGNIAVAESFE